MPVFFVDGEVVLFCVHALMLLLHKILLYEKIPRSKGIFLYSKKEQVLKQVSKV